MSGLKFKLRQYQQKFCRAVVDLFEKGEFFRLLAVLGTGGGKTICFSFLAWYFTEKLKLRVLIIADSDELVDQACAKLFNACGIYAAVEKAERRASLEAMVVVACAQSIWIPDRLARFPKDHFGLIVADECHLSLSDGWQRILNHFTGKILGVTATPGRGDNQNLMSFYQKVAFEYGLFDLIRDNWLSPITVQSVPIHAKMGKLRKTRSKKEGEPADFSKDQLDETLTPYFDEIISAIIEHAPKRKILVFQPLIKTSLAFVKRCNERGIEARHIAGVSKDRSEILQGFRDGKFQLLSNSMMLTKGYDEPEIDCIVNLRLTQNPTLYQQIIGRGTRLFCPQGCNHKCDHPEAKQDLLILDFLFQFEKCAIMRPGDLVAKTKLEADMINAAALKGAPGPKSLTAIAEEGLKEAEIELMRALERRKYGQKKSFSGQEWAARVDTKELLRVDKTRDPAKLGISPKQKALLQRNGIDLQSLRDGRHARRVMTMIFYRYKHKLATLKQVIKMKEFGIANAETLSMTDASVEIARFLNRRH